MIDCADAVIASVFAIQGPYPQTNQIEYARVVSEPGNLALKTKPKTKVKRANIISGFKTAHETPKADPRYRSAIFNFHIFMVNFKSSRVKFKKEICEFILLI
jgi:hypothetical protein